MSGRALHAGCGGHSLPDWLPGEWDEVKLDINPNCNPDVVASITDLGDIGSYDLIYSSHCLEHLFPWEVEKALSEFLRVLVPGGKLLLLLPDLEGVSPTNEVLFEADCGPVTGLDMYYGHADSIKLNSHMQHKTGFIKSTLEAALVKAGFSTVVVNRVKHFNLMGGGIK